MPELLAGDIGWLGAGGLFAWVLGALLRLAAIAAAPSVHAESDAKSRCSRNEPPLRLRAARRGRLALVILLPGVPLALAVAGAAHAAHAIAATLAGATCGVWLGRRYGRPARPRLIAGAGCAVGAAAVAGGFALHLLMPRHDMLARGALYLAVSLGAWMLAAAVSAWFVDVTREESARGRRCVATAKSALDDFITYGLTLVLCAALAYGFVVAQRSAQFRLAALIAACGLAAALGVRMMTGAHFAAIKRPSGAEWRTLIARADTNPLARAGLAGIPDELLVAACGSEMFDASCLALPGADGNAREYSYARHRAPVPAMRRRQRGRYGASAARRLSISAQHEFGTEL
jgi:hypothetical protein